jgi:predicted enzyme related to lactoylglutathione lyase
LNFEALTEVSTNANQQPTIRRSAETGSIDESLKAIEKAEGKVVTPKHSIGEWGFMADFADLEGNIIALREKPVR